MCRLIVFLLHNEIFTFPDIGNRNRIFISRNCIGVSWRLMINSATEWISTVDGTVQLKMNFVI